jgi:hypothetical protein
MGAFAIMKMDLKRIFRSPKLYLLMFFTLYFLMDFARDIKTYAGISGMGVTPYIYPFFYGNWMFRMFAMLVIIALMSDAPYVDSSQKYTYIRTGDGKWLAGKVLFITAVSFLYQFLFLVFSILVLVPDIGFSTEWGDILTTLANMTASVSVTIGDSTSLAYIQSRYSPAEAMVLTFVLASLVGIVVGLFIFLVNGLSRSMAGTMLALVICTADLFVGMMQNFGFHVSFPLVVSWMDISSIYTGEKVSGKMFLGNVFLTVAAVSAVFIGLLYLAVRKKWIDIAEK